MAVGRAADERGERENVRCVCFFNIKNEKSGGVVGYIYVGKKYMVVFVLNDSVG